MARCWVFSRCRLSSRLLRSRAIVPIGDNKIIRIFDLGSVLYLPTALEPIVALLRTQLFSPSSEIGLREQEKMHAEYGPRFVVHGACRRHLRRPLPECLNTSARAPEALSRASLLSMLTSAANFDSLPL